MWSLVLAVGAMFLALANASAADYKSFDEYLDYYEYDLDTEDGEEVLAEIDARIEAKEETYDRYRRQILVERSRDRDLEIPDEEYTGEEHCPETCTCRDSEVRCISKSLPEIPRGIPPGVEKLILAFNKITDIPPRSFDKFRSSLGFLFLHSNEIRSIGNGLFSKMHEITVLRLSWNKISGIRKSSLHGLDKVERLYLDNNRLTFIHPLAFRGLTNLVFLQLDGNKLSRLHQNVFVTLEFQKYFRHSSIEYLYLGRNEFSNLPRHIFDPMTDLRQVHLHGNRWQCSCEMKWLKKWIDHEKKYKCKRNSFKPRGRDECAVCAWPPRLRGKKLKDVPQYSFKCQPPNFIPEEIPAAISDLDPDTLQKENDLALFNLSGFYSTRMNLRLDSYRRSMIHASCRLSAIPTVRVANNGRDAKTFRKRYLATFEGSFQCYPEYPTKSTELWKLLEPYVGREMSFVQRVSRGSTGVNAKSYVISVNQLSERPTVPLTRGSISSISKFLLSDSLDITIHSELEGLEASSTFNVDLRTSFDYTHDPGEVKYSKHPWLLIRQPEPSTMAVTLALERKTAVYRCKAVGQPKPKITWILPSGEALRSGESKLRYSVTRSGRLVIKKSVPEDSGYFHCLATISESRNSTRDSSKAAAEISNLRIEVFPRAQGTFVVFNSRGLRMEYVEPGHDWSSICSVESLPNATTGWITPNEQLFVGKSETSDKRTKTEGGTITVTNFTESDQGLYRCVAANAAGRAEHSVFVSIQSNEDELMETIEEPEMEEPEISISTMVFPPNFDSDEKEEKDFEIVPTGSKVHVAPISPNISSVISSSNSPVIPPVSPVNSPKLEPDEDASNKYFDFMSTPTSFDKLPVLAVTKHRSRLPGGFSPTPTSTAASPKSSKIQKQTNHPASARKNASRDRASRKGQEAPYNHPNLIPLHPRAPPAANSFLNGFTQTVTASPGQNNIASQPAVTFSRPGIIPTSSSTTSVATSSTRTRPPSRVRPRLPTTRRTGTRRRVGVGQGTRRLSVLRGQNQKVRIIPARRVGDERDMDVPTRRILDTGDEMIEVPAGRIQEPRRLQLVDRLIKARPGDRMIIPCARILRNPTPNSWTFRWSLPLGEVFERPGRASTPDLRKFILPNGALYLASVTTRDSGEYTCLAQARSGFVEYLSPITLAVLSNRLEIRDRPIEYIRVQIDDSIAVDCSATGNPRPVVTWRTPQGAIIQQMSTRGRNEVFRNGTLYIHMISPSDYGAYVCTATNGLETRTRTLVILTPTQRRPLPTRRSKGPARNPRPITNQSNPRTRGQTTTEAVASSRESRSTTTPLTSTIRTRGGSPSTNTPLTSATTTSSESSSTVTPLTSTARTSSESSSTTTPLTSSTRSESLSTTTPLTSTTTTFTATSTTTTTTTTRMTSPDIDDVTMPEEIISFPEEETTAETLLMDDPLDSFIVIEQESSVAYGDEDGRTNFHCIDRNVEASSDGWLFVWTMASGDVYQRPGNYVSRDWSKFVHRNGSLSLHYLKLGDAGVYSCVATDRSEGFEYHKEVTLIVRPNQKRPKISNPAKENISAGVGESPSIPCDATGEPMPTITWTTPRGARIKNGTTVQRFEVLQNGTLRINEIRTLERGSYTCDARNTNGVASRTVVLRVSYRPPRFVDSPRVTIRGRVGERVLLSCAVTGYPPPRKFWLLPTRTRISTNEAIFSNVGRYSLSARRRSRQQSEAKYRVTSDGTLVINQTDESDIGRYHCVISNNAGRAASTVNLLVSG